MAVEGWVGWHGQGKTYVALAQALMRLLDHDVPLITNAIVVGHVRAPVWLAAIDGREQGGAALPQVLHFETWDELAAVLEAVIRHNLRAQVLVDEAGKFLSSRFFTKMDERVLMVLQERRKIGRGLDFLFTAPSLDHVDKILRDVTQVVHKSKRLGGNEYSHDAGRPPRAFVLSSWRPEQIGKPKGKPMRRQIVPFSKELADLYTTGVVTMGPNANSHASKPDLRDGEPTVIQEFVPVAVPVSGGRRGRRRRG